MSMHQREGCINLGMDGYRTYTHSRTQNDLP
jgi:hypothetical protein